MNYKQKIKRLEKERDLYKKGLNELASWNEGPVVHSGFDDPDVAEFARELLEKGQNIRKPKGE